jgi:hypothetical protein
MNPRNLLEVDHSKAGMQTADKAQVERVVNELSKIQVSTPTSNESKRTETRESRNCCDSALNSTR